MVCLLTKTKKTKPLKTQAVSYTYSEYERKEYSKTKGANVGSL